MEGLRVLAVDDDRPFLAILEKMLLSCHYQATICSNGEDALSILREDKNTFDIILCDVEIPDVDGFKLLEVIRSTTDVPVVLMSGDDSSEAVKKSVINGACDFLVKPVTIEQVGVIWQHVLRRRQNGLKDNASRVGGSNTDKNEEDEEEDDEASPENGTRAKKPRIIWTTELHEKFFLAVKQLGIDKAVPKKILECMQHMGVTELSRENVASHLQKFRLYVRKRNVDSLDQSGNSSSLAGLNGFDQPPPSLAGLTGFDQPSSSGHQFGSAQYQYGHVVPTPLHEQRKLLDPMMLLHSTQAHHLHGGVSANLGFGPGQELLPLGQPVLSFPGVGNSSLFESGNGYGHANVVPNYSMDDRGVIMTEPGFVPNGHLYEELIKHEGFGGGGGLLPEQGSGHEAHLYSYEKDGPFFDQTL